LNGDEEKIREKIQEWRDEPQEPAEEREDVEKKSVKKQSPKPLVPAGGGGGRARGRGRGREHGRGGGGGRGGGDRRERGRGGAPTKAPHESVPPKPQEYPKTEATKPAAAPVPQEPAGIPPPATSTPTLKGAWGARSVVAPSPVAAPATPAPATIESPPRKTIRASENIKMKEETQVVKRKRKKLYDHDEQFEVAKNMCAKNHFKCIVCGEILHTTRPVYYPITKCIPQYGLSDKELVKVGRKHCETSHPKTWIWNMIPTGHLSAGQEPLTHESTVDMILHQAMSLAARKHPIDLPYAENSDFYMIIFEARMVQAMTWMDLKCPIYIRRFDQAYSGIVMGAREVAEQRIKEMRWSARRHMLSDATKRKLQRILQVNSYDLYNEFQLTFLELGRYKRCDLFLESKFVQKFRKIGS
jgi:hypothetical protein